MGEVDVILGMAWLVSLGEMWVDWRRHITKFEVEGEEVVLWGYSGSLLSFLFSA